MATIVVMRLVARGGGSLSRLRRATAHAVRREGCGSTIDDHI
jgi:hypothetical protein